MTHGHVCGVEEQINSPHFPANWSVHAERILSYRAISYFQREILRSRLSFIYPFNYVGSSTLCLPFLCLHLFMKMQIIKNYKSDILLKYNYFTSIVTLPSKTFACKSSEGHRGLFWSTLLPFTSADFWLNIESNFQKKRGTWNFDMETCNLSAMVRQSKTDRLYYSLI